MKKEYIKPVTENVHVKLFGSVLGAIGVGPKSNGVEEGDAKQNDINWGDDSFTPDLWGDEEEEDF